MSRHFNFYLDESGSSLSVFFVIGGFWLGSDDYSEIQKIENKIKANVLRTEKAIKEFRQIHEPENFQYIVGENNKLQKEVKWNTLSTQNKEFLFNNLNDYNQNNLSISCSLDAWAKKTKKPIELDPIFNMMVYKLIEDVLKEEINDFDEKIVIKISVDQRKLSPKVNNENLNSLRSSRLESLEGYLNTQLYLHSDFTNIDLKVSQFNSSASPLIRYSDFYAGLISSMCRLIDGSTRPWDERMDEFLSVMHNKIKCDCRSIIENQCSIIDKISLYCKNFRRQKENSK